MSEVMLYIKGDPSAAYTQVDLYENESLSYNERFSDVAEFKSLGSFSRSFRIPASPNNDALFQGWPNANSTTFSAVTKAPARIDIDTIPYRTGHIQLNQVYLKGEVVHEYEITFYAESPDLIRSIGDKKVAQLADLSTLDHEVNYANVTTGSAGEWDYALCDRGQRFSEVGEQGTRPLYSANWPLNAGDMTPLVNAKWLVDNIVKDAGFEWEGWDGSTELADSLIDIWVPWLNSRYIKYTAAEDSYFFGINNGADETGVTFTYGQIRLLSAMLPSYAEVYDNGNHVSGEVFTAPFTGYYTFKLWTTAKHNTVGQSEWIQLLIQQSGNTTSAGTIRASAQFMLNSPFTWYNDSFTAVDVFLSAGDTIEMAVKTSSGTFSFQGGTYGPNSEQIHCGMRLISVSQPMAGETINMVANAPDVKQIDLLRDIIKMHNVAVIPDRLNAKKIYLEPMVTYLGSGATLDWTDRVDLEKDMVLSPTTDLQNKVMKWTYKAGADAASELFVKQAGRVYGDYLVEGYQPAGGQQPNEFATGDTTIELTASSTPCFELRGTSIVTATFMNDGGEFQIPGLRFVYIAGTAAQVSFTDDDLPNPSPVPTTVLADLNVINHYSSTQPDVDDFDLNFAPETPLHPVPVNPYNNLFRRWYMNYLNDIYDFRARKLEAHLKLTLGDVINFTFSDRVWIKDSYWRVLEISDYLIGAEQSTKVTLLKIVNPDADCAFTPVSVSPGGVVSFEDVDGNPGGSQTCCERYGYTWDDDDQKCYSFRGKKPPINAYQSGLTGWGVAGQSAGGPNSQTPGGVIVGTGLEMSPGVGYSVVAGQGVTLRSGNFNVIAVGDRIVLNEDTRSASMFGNNIEANQPGFHLGGGWEGDDRTTTLGRAQHGTIILSGEGSFTNSGDELPVVINGISGYYLEIDDNATWVCEAHVITHQFNPANSRIIGVHYGVYVFSLSRTNNVSSASGVDTIKQDGDLGTKDLLIDTATNTAQHRFSIQSTGSGNYPHNDIKITMALTYTQVRT